MVRRTAPCVHGWDISMMSMPSHVYSSRGRQWLCIIIWPHADPQSDPCSSLSSAGNAVYCIHDASSLSGTSLQIKSLPSHSLSALLCVYIYIYTAPHESCRSVIHFTCQLSLCLIVNMRVKICEYKNTIILVLSAKLCWRKSTLCMVSLCLAALLGIRNILELNFIHFCKALATWQHNIAVPMLC